MISVEVVAAVSSDLSAINYIRQQIASDPTSPHKTSDISLSDIAQSDRLITFVAKTVGKVVGYLSLHTSTSLQDSAEVEFEMFVSPSLQRQGVGSKLLQHAEAFAIEHTRASRLTLGVLNTNPDARRLYERNGYYSTGKDSLGEHMAKNVVRQPVAW